MTIKSTKKHFLHIEYHQVFTSLLLSATLVFMASTAFFIGQKYFLQDKWFSAAKKNAKTEKSLQHSQKELKQLQTDDQYLKNKKINEEMTNIEKTYAAASKSYEELIKLRTLTKTGPLDEQYAKIIFYLSEKKFTSGSALLVDLNNKIKTERTKAEAAAASSVIIPENVKTSTSAPGAGYARQYVKNDYGTYMVDIVAADLSTKKIIVDTASDGTCGNDCPVMSLGAYAGRSGAIAGINGPYFCPASYPACGGKTNSFDTLLMNKNKTYFNSDNNVYSTVPAVIFQSGSARFVGHSLEWGRDTGPDSVIASQPFLISSGNVVFGGDSEIKRAGKGSRSFIGSTGGTGYIGVVYNANVAEVAQVLKTLGIQNALNLDSGGSTALWSGGKYIVGPGRDLPFGILIVNR
ncbi:hypothetical protein BH09PAT2_BH09PAT2_10840 [soil metagenome]